MSDVNAAVRSVLSISAGALFYAALNWVPVIGPLSVGAFTGYVVGGGFKRGFNHGICASTAGAILVAYLLASYNILPTTGTNTLLKAFTIWVLLVWNITGILFAGVGGGFGAVGKDLQTMIPKGIHDMISPPKTKPGVNYMICKNCGQGNVEAAETCVSCNIKLR
ncbi:MAG: hypothetical protein V1744_06500 [Candidatus Altiarchaeota archaeon]